MNKSEIWEKHSSHRGIDSFHSAIDLWLSFSFLALCLSQHRLIPIALRIFFSRLVRWELSVAFASVHCVHSGSDVKSLLSVSILSKVKPEEVLINGLSLSTSAPPHSNDLQKLHTILYTHSGILWAQQHISLSEIMNNNDKNRRSSRWSVLRP